MWATMRSRPIGGAAASINRPAKLSSDYSSGWTGLSPGWGPIYPRGPVAPPFELADQRFTEIDWLDLQAYVAVCRARVRDGADSAGRVRAVLAGYDLTPERWALISQAWTARIRRDPDVRS